MEKRAGHKDRPFVTPLRLRPGNGGASTSVVALLLSWPAAAAIISLGAELIRRHLARTLVLGELVGDLLTFLEITHASALDGADVDEHVLPAVIRLDETETLGRIEPLDCTGAHDEPFHGIIDGARRISRAVFRSFSGKVVSVRKECAGPSRSA
jgi:hypothetical protein